MGTILGNDMDEALRRVRASDATKTISDQEVTLPLSSDEEMTAALEANQEHRAITQPQMLIKQPDAKPLVSWLDSFIIYGNSAAQRCSLVTTGRHFKPRKTLVQKLFSK